MRYIETRLWSHLNWECRRALLLRRSRVNNVYVCAVSSLSSRHKKKITLFLAVGESKALNDKTVIYRDGCICLEVILIGGNDLNTCDFQ